MLNSLMASTTGMGSTGYYVVLSFKFAFIILLFLAAIATTILILFQKSNSEGIQGITASSETFFGKNKGRSIESKLKKWTWICLIVIGVLAITIYILQIVLATLFS